LFCSLRAICAHRSCQACLALGLVALDLAGLVALDLAGLVALDLAAEKAEDRRIGTLAWSERRFVR